MTYITGTISPNSFSHLSISIHSYNSITVNNKYHSVRHPLLINSIRSCLKSKSFYFLNSNITYNYISRTKFNSQGPIFKL